MVELVEHFTLAQGERRLDIPKVGQITFSALADGVDISSSEDIGMTVTQATTSEVGAKVILTDKLVRQENEDIWKVVGRQLGDGLGRIKDTDLLGLFSALNGGTSLGAAGATLTLANMAACIDFAKRNKFSRPQMIVVHPTSLFDVVHQSAAIPSMTSPIPAGFSEDLLRDFYAFKVNQVPVFEDGNITIDSLDDMIGAIIAKNALGFLESVGFSEERERDASLRATELVMVADYGAFELDDSEGAPLTYDAAQISTSA